MCLVVSDPIMVLFFYFRFNLLLSYKMTSHRELTDSQFDTHLASLDDSSLANKLTAWQSAKTELDTERTSVTSHRTQITKHARKVTNMIDDLEGLQAYALLESTPSQQDRNICFVNASASSSGADGSFEKPYPSLADAIDSKIAPGDTAVVIFDIAVGVYTVTKTITQTSAQNVSFRGAGVGKTILHGGATFDDGKGLDILRLSGYADLEFSGITFQNARYGLRPTCAKLTVIDCEFLRCGSSGAADSHDNSLSITAQNARWTAALLLTNGGALRCDGASGVVRVSRNRVSHCLRGIRVTGALLGGIISENDVYLTAESGIYLSVGCLNVVVQSNKLVGCGNNGILMINSRYCHVINNTVDECWNCGIQVWNSSEVSIQSNSVRDCGFSLHNAIGLLGDCWASGVTLAGNTNIAADAEFQARIFSNIFIQLHDTRSGSKIAILVTNNAYTSGDEIYVSGNCASDDVDYKVKIDPSAVGQDPNVKDLLPVDYYTLYPFSVADGDLTIAKTTGLQTALDAKQATLGVDSVAPNMVQDLAIAKITGLQTALDAGGSDIYSASKIQIETHTTSGEYAMTSSKRIYIAKHNNIQNITIRLPQVDSTFDGQIFYVKNANTNASGSSPLFVKINATNEVNHGIRFDYNYTGVQLNSDNSSANTTTTSSNQTLKVLYIHSELVFIRLNDSF